MINGASGDIVTLPCPYRPGNYLSAYEIEWITLKLGSTLLLVNDEDLELNQTDFSLSFVLSPFSDGLYQCRVAIRSDSPGDSFLVGPFIYGMLMIHQYF